MLLNEKITIIRKMNNLSQERFAEELGVSRQTISKWETGNVVPDVGMLTNIADYYNITLDQLVRDEYELPMAKDVEKVVDTTPSIKIDKFDLSKYLGKVCDISMNSFRYSVIRNAKIVGMWNGMVCFEKKNSYGYFNARKSLGILVKSQEDYIPHNRMECGKCTAYVNKGNYYGGHTYMFSCIEDISENGLKIRTGEFISEVSFDDLSVIQMKSKINK